MAKHKKQDLPPSTRIVFENEEGDDTFMQKLLESSFEEPSLLPIESGEGEPPSPSTKNQSQEDDPMAQIFESIPTPIVPKETDSLEDVDVPSSKKRKPIKKIYWDYPDATLDLHGKTREEAILMVQNFVMAGHTQNLRSLLIITGRGKHSGEAGPILNQTVWNWLKKNGKQYVHEFFSAPAEHGGDGAIWINLL